MKINYRLEISYQIFEKGKTFFELKNYVFNSNNSQKNREDAINEFENFKHVFLLASKLTNDIKLSITEVANKKISGFKVPSLNIYYSMNDFDDYNEGMLLMGDYLEESDEKYTYLEREFNTYKKENISGIKKEVIKDYLGNTYSIIPPINNNNKDILKELLMTT